MIVHIFKRRRLLVLSGIILLAWTVLLSSCASEKLVSSWADPAMTGKKIEDVLVIVAAKDDTIRKLFENSFERSFQKEGVKSFTGHTVEAVQESITYDTVLQATKSTGAKMALITRLTDVRQKSVTRDSLGRSYVSLEDAPYGPGMFYAGSAMSTSTNTKTKVHIECLLYDVATKKLVSNTRYEMINPVMTNKYLDGVTRFNIAEFKKQNLL